MIIPSALGASVLIRIADQQFNAVAECGS